jgi:hypothetical protein
MGVGSISSVRSSSLQQYQASGGTASDRSAKSDITQQAGQAGDTVEISQAGMTAYQNQKKKLEESPAYRNAINELTATQKKVIAHEMAHMAKGGDIAGAASYSYSTGPDGRRYITGGEVPLSIPTTDDKEQMLKELEKVRNAALAPAEPSGQDLKVASEASAQIQKLRGELAAGDSEDSSKQGTQGNT